MSLRDAVNSFLGRKKDSEISDCPRETEILSYLEDRTPTGKRAQMEAHFTKCPNCREFLAIFSRVSEEYSEEVIEPAPEEEVKTQTALVLDEIRKDESKHQTLSPEPSRRTGIYIPRWQLAAAASFILIVAISIYWATREPSPDQFARQSLALAMKDKRPIEPRISGGFSWSEYAPTRGAEESEHLKIENAIKRMSFARTPSAPQEDRLALARLYLASGRQNAEEALTILREIASNGKASAEAFNDLGAALFETGRLDEAIAAFTRALEKSPGYEEALFNRALASHRAGHTEEARRDWQEFINKSSDERWKTEARRYLNSLTPAR
jgi:tetratricopeptide (TPR) repeat protein